jgi:hypothetical protein
MKRFQAGRGEHFCERTSRIVHDSSLQIVSDCAVRQPCLADLFFLASRVSSVHVRPIPGCKDDSCVAAHSLPLRMHACCPCGHAPAALCELWMTSKNFHDSEQPGSVAPHAL